MIKISLKTLADSHPNLKKVCEFNYLIETRFRMAKVLMRVEVEKALYDKQRSDLLKKYGEQVGIDTYNIRKDTFKAFSEELDELNAIEVEIPVDKFLHSNVRDQIESPADIVALSWLIDWPELQEVKEEPAAEKSAEAANA